MSATTHSYRRQDRSVRMTFRFERGDIELVERQEIDTVAPPSQEVPEREETAQSGFWVELRDADGRTIYRRVMRNPIRAAAEVPDGEGGFTNRVSVAPAGMFSLLVPNLPEAMELALFASPLDRPHMPEPATEVVRAPFRAPRGDQGDRPNDGDRPDEGDRPDQREPEAKRDDAPDDDPPRGRFGH